MAPSIPPADDADSNNTKYFSKAPADMVCLKWIVLSECAEPVLSLRPRSARRLTSGGGDDNPKVTHNRHPSIAKFG